MQGMKIKIITYVIYYATFNLSKNSILSKFKPLNQVRLESFPPFSTYSLSEFNTTKAMSSCSS